MNWVLVVLEVGLIVLVVVGARAYYKDRRNDD